MSRIDYILHYGLIPGDEPVVHCDKTKFKKAIFKALVYCLTPEETCACLDIEFKMQGAKHHILIDKILRDVQGGARPCHFDLIETLVARYNTYNVYKKQSAGFLLSRLFTVAMGIQQYNMLMMFLQSKNHKVRFRAYEILRSEWNADYATAIKEAWQQHSDPECAMLIVAHFPVDFILNNLVELHRCLASNRRMLHEL